MAIRVREADSEGWARSTPSDSLRYPTNAYRHGLHRTRYFMIVRVTDVIRERLQVRNAGLWEGSCTKRHGNDALLLSTPHMTEIMADQGCLRTGEEFTDGQLKTRRSSTLRAVYIPAHHILQSSDPCVIKRHKAQDRI